MCDSEDRSGHSEVVETGGRVSVGSQSFAGCTSNLEYQDDLRRELNLKVENVVLVKYGGQVGWQSPLPTLDP